MHLLSLVFLPRHWLLGHITTPYRLYWLSVIEANGTSLCVSSKTDLFDGELEWFEKGKNNLKMCTVSHTLLLFIGILGPPTFLLRRLIAAGCAALHTRGKHNSSYISKPFLSKLGDLQRHVLNSFVCAFRAAY